METESKEVKTDFSTLLPKDALKSRINWNTVRPPAPNTWNSSSNNFTLDLPTNGVFIPDDSFCTFKAYANQPNLVADNVYTRQVQLSSSWAPFSRIDISVNSVPVYSIPDPAVINSLLYAYVGDDYRRTVALDTGLYAPDSVQKYFEGGNLTNVDVLGALPLKVTLTGADPADGAEVNTCVATHTKDDLNGVNNLLGLSLAPVADTGVPVPVGNYYRLDIGGLFNDMREWVLLASQPIRLTFWLNDLNSVYYASGANLPTDYTITDFAFHMKMVQIPTRKLEEKIKDLVEGDFNIAKRSFYRYETYRLFQQSIQAGEQNILISHNVNLPNVKAIFLFFRPNAEINALGTKDKKSCFVFPNTTATATATYQFSIDGVPHPTDQVTVGPKRWVRAYDMCLQAFDALDNFEGGVKTPAVAMGQRGNFIIGMRFQANELASSRYVGRLEIPFNMSAVAGAVYSSQVLVVYDTEMTMGASKIDVVPAVQPSI